jgi:Uma2 family endonuclease
MATLPRYDLPQQEFVSVREYLSTVYEPDCDYVDGRLEERNLGEYDHALLQGLILNIFLNSRTAWGIVATPETRIQVKPARFRVPDVTVLRSGTPREQILTHPPLLVIEILSPEDRLARIAKRNEDYLQFGIEHIWVIDPRTRKAYRNTAAGLQPIQSGELIIAGTPIRIVLSDLFAELDAV